MRPTPYIYLGSSKAIASFIERLYNAGYSWAGYPYRSASTSAIQYSSCVYWARGPKTVYVDAAARDGSTYINPANSTKPFVLVNSPAHLIAYMRETDRLKETHS